MLAELSTYTALKTLHVLAAVTWVGGSIALQVIATRVQRERDPKRLAEMAGHFEFVGNRLFVASRIELVLLILIVADMVIKPGVG